MPQGSIVNLYEASKDLSKTYPVDPALRTGFGLEENLRKLADMEMIQFFITLILNMDESTLPWISLTSAHAIGCPGQVNFHDFERWRISSRQYLVLTGGQPRALRGGETSRSRKYSYLLPIKVLITGIRTNSQSRNQGSISYDPVQPRSHKRCTKKDCKFAATMNAGSRVCPEASPHCWKLD